MTEAQYLSEFIREWESDCLTVLAKTSGSTGVPKEIKLDKEDMKASARRTIKFFGLGSDSCLYSCVSSRFIGGKMMWVRGSELNCRVIFEEPSMRPTLSGVDSEGKVCNQIDLLSVVPTQLGALMEEPEKLERVRRILVGGAALSDVLREKIIHAGPEVWESYGMTETCSHIALRKVSESEAGFQPLEGIEIFKDDRECLNIRIEDRVLSTNDIVSIKEDGTFNVLGRYDNVIITGGKKINPEEIENKLAGCLSRVCNIREGEYAISSVNDEIWGNKMVLIVSRRSRDPELTIDNLRKMVFLEKWQYPKEVIEIEAIPMTSNGKIDRIKLRELIQS